MCWNQWSLSDGVQVVKESEIGGGTGWRLVYSKHMYCSSGEKVMRGRTYWISHSDRVTMIESGSDCFRFQLSSWSWRKSSTTW